MSTLVVANGNETEAAELALTLAVEHQVVHAVSATELMVAIDGCDLLLLDANFTPAHSIDVLNEVASHKHLPILMVVPQDEPKCAVEAMRAGAFNYIVKSPGYLDLILHAVEMALKLFFERDAMQQTILTLKARVAELEALCGVRGLTPASSPAQRSKRDVMADILTLLRQGEINLPVYPKSVIELRRLVGGDAPLEAVVKLLEQDVSIAAKLIRVSNSAHYRSANDHVTIAQAIGRLGLKQACNIVELLSNRALYTSSMPNVQAFLAPLWTHAVACANAAQLTARQLKLDNADAAFTMGLLHDIGKLVLLQVLGELQLRGVLETMDPWDAMEIAQQNHCRFGNAVLKRWKFPDEIAHAALWHENIHDAEAITKSLLLVHFANVLANSMGYGPTQPVTTDLQSTESARLLKLTPATIADIQNELRDLMSVSEFSS